MSHLFGNLCYHMGTMSEIGGGGGELFGRGRGGGEMSDYH